MLFVLYIDIRINSDEICKADRRITNMMIPMGELLAKAKKEGYGVAAPNVFKRETIEACFLAAKK